MENSLLVDVCEYCVGPVAKVSSPNVTWTGNAFYLTGIRETKIFGFLLNIIFVLLSAVTRVRLRWV